MVHSSIKYVVSNVAKILVKQYMCQFHLVVFVMVIIYEKEATDAI